MASKPTSRRCSSKLKERVALRNVYELEQKRVQARKEELEKRSFRIFLAERDTYYPAEFESVAKDLGSTLVFKQVAPDHKTSFEAFSREEGQKLAKKLSFFLRHHLPTGDYSENDGSVAVEVIQQKLGYSKEDILLATNPEYDGSSQKDKMIVAKLLHGQRYPMPLCWCMWGECEERGSGPGGANDL